MKRGRRCQVCIHAERERIEALRAAGASLDTLAEKFGIERTALHRHWTRHVSPERKTEYLIGPATIAELRERAAKEGGSLLDYLTIMRSILMGALVTQGEVRSPFGVATVSGKLLECLREIGKLTGEIARLNPSITINNNLAIVTSPQFLQLQDGLLKIARAHPDVRGEIVALIRKLDERQEPGPKMIEGAVNAA